MFCVDRRGGEGFPENKECNAHAVGLQTSQVENGVLFFHFMCGLTLKWRRARSNKSVREWEGALKWLTSWSARWQIGCLVSPM